MGLESAGFISSLTATWPLAGDNKSVGDDHIRLLKTTLQSTFPNADRAFRFPTAEATATTIVLDATDQHNHVIVDTSGGNVAVTLPSTLAAADKGWQCCIIKTSNDANAAIVSPASGTIGTKVGSVATVRVGILNEPATFFWTGTAWLCWKFGPAIGSTENFDGASVPPGYLAADGSTYSNTTFAELFAALATTTLRDKRGRTEIGDGTGSGLTARVSGTTYGNETKTLAAADIPAGVPSRNASQSISVTVANTSVPSNPYIPVTSGSVSPGTAGGAGSVNFPQSSTGAWSYISAMSGTTANDINVTSTNAGQTAVGLLQPSIGVKKIIRAC